MWVSLLVNGLFRVERLVVAVEWQMWVSLLVSVVLFKAELVVVAVGWLV